MAQMERVWAHSGVKKASPETFEVLGTSVRVSGEANRGENPVRRLARSWTSVSVRPTQVRRERPSNGLG